jgi:hypothetical protein
MIVNNELEKTCKELVITILKVNKWNTWSAVPCTWKNKKLPGIELQSLVKKGM